MSEAAGTKVLRELNASRSDIVTGPDQGRSVSIFRPPGIAAAWADLQLARLHTTRQQRMNGALGKPKKKKGKVEVRPINLGTDYEYGVLNIHLIAYDMALAESYAQYVHNLCNHLAIKVEESYAMPTKTMEVLQLQEQGSKMFLDAVLTTHERVVQISGLSATFAEIFLEIIHSNLPEGVKLSVREHTEEDFKGRFKARPELEELLAKLN
uniref:Large ribosomal subunit protein mL48 n=1 Tax=Sus scrofa TaxID=9823 RepID=A0A8D1SN64_PIG